MNYRHLISTLTIVLTVCTALSAATLDDTTGPQLLKAVRESNATLVTQLLRNGADINFHTREGNTALMTAAKIGDKPTIEAILNGSPDVNFRNQTGTTALMIAAKYGHMHVVEMLLENGADPSITNNSGVLASRFAQVYDHPDVFRQLIEAERVGVKKVDKTKLSSLKN